MSGKHFVQVPICPQVSPGAKKAGVIQDDEFVLYEAAFTSGVRLTVKLVSDKERYQVVPEFRFPDGGTTIGKCITADPLSSLVCFQSGHENGSHGYSVELVPLVFSFHLFGEEWSEKNCWCAEILSADLHFDANARVRAAAAYFLKTEEGKEVLNRTCGNFNWGDAVQEIPGWVCLKHGFLINNVYEAEHNKRVWRNARPFLFGKRLSCRLAGRHFICAAVRPPALAAGRFTPDYAVEYPAPRRSPAPHSG